MEHGPLAFVAGMANDDTTGKTTLSPVKEGHGAESPRARSKPMSIAASPAGASRASAIPAGRVTSVLDDLYPAMSPSPPIAAAAGVGGTPWVDDDMPFSFSPAGSSMQLSRSMLIDDSGAAAMKNAVHGRWMDTIRRESGGFGRVSTSGRGRSTSGTSGRGRSESTSSMGSCEEEEPAGAHMHAHGAVTGRMHAGPTAATPWRRSRAHAGASTERDAASCECGSAPRATTSAEPVLAGAGVARLKVGSLPTEILVPERMRRGVSGLQPGMCGGHGHAAQGGAARRASVSDASSYLSLSPTICADTPLRAPHNGRLASSGLSTSAGSARGGGKNWRRAFVQSRTSASRKIEYIHNSQCREVEAAVQLAVAALDGGAVPNLVEDGLGGTYFIKDKTGDSIAVFKPRDEEPLAPNNPKVHTGGNMGAIGMKHGVLIGEAALNEYASFLIDSARSPPCLRAGVSPTALVRFAHHLFHDAATKGGVAAGKKTVLRKVIGKVGSLQCFVSHSCTGEDVGSSLFPVDEVHRIAALDIRLCNTDRHAGNILVRYAGGGGDAGGEHVQDACCGADAGRGRDVEKLIPIDHGYCLPAVQSLEEVVFEWLYWPQAKEPFSEEMRTAILALEEQEDERLLRRKLPNAMRDNCLRTLRVCTSLLKRAVQHGLTPHDIGMMMTRPFTRRNEPPVTSTLEQMVAEAQEVALHATYWMKHRPEDANNAARRSMHDENFFSAFQRIASSRCRELAANPHAKGPKPLR